MIDIERTKSQIPLRELVAELAITNGFGEVGREILRASKDFEEVERGGLGYNHAVGCLVRDPRPAAKSLKRDPTGLKWLKKRFEDKVIFNGPNDPQVIAFGNGIDFFLATCARLKVSK